VVINEFMPDPDGSDDEEWIELYNRGGARVLLLDWRLDDSEGGSRAYSVKDAVWIEAGAYYVFERADTGLALNNNTDAVRLFAPDGQGVDTVEYEGAKEGLSYALGAAGQWAWSTAPTPGGANSIKVSNAKASAAKASYAKASAAKASYAKASVAKDGGSKAASAGIRTVALKDVRLLDAGDDVVIRGWAAVLPGVLGSQYFYLHDSEGGAQVYSYKKDFPAFKIGDHIEAKGEIGISNGERRVKTKTKADIRVLAPAGACPEPAALKCEEIIEEAVGRLVTVAGEVSERKSSNVRLDDGTGEGAVYVKSATGINAGRFRPGDKAEVTGIVTLAADGARVLPRSNDDIKIARDTAANNVLGAFESSSEWTLPQRESRIGWYYGALVVGFILSLIGWWARGRRSGRGG
jgi:DNA/RNA endonuclease YhcR with UshA esterase domain